MAHNINGQSAVPPLRSSLTVAMRNGTLILFEIPYGHGLPHYCAVVMRLKWLIKDGESILIKSAGVIK